MMASVDGRIDCAMTEQIESGDEYYEALAELGCPSLLMGRVTMQLHYAAAEPFVAKEPAPIGRQAVHVARRAGGYLVAVDTHGSLCWPAGEFDGQPLLVITSEKCAAEYLDTLAGAGISWIAVGEERIDLPEAMEMLRETFGVERLAVVGGGNINGAFLAAGLLDEVSLMVAPGIDGRVRRHRRCGAAGHQTAAPVGKTGRRGNRMDALRVSSPGGVKRRFLVPGPGDASIVTGTVWMIMDLI